MLVAGAPAIQADDLARAAADIARVDRAIAAVRPQVHQQLAQLDPNAAAALVVRLDQVEAEQRQITGTFEELKFQIEQLKQRLERLNSDVDFRLREIEGKAGGGAASRGGATTAMAPAVGAGAGNLQQTAPGERNLGQLSGRDLAVNAPPPPPPPPAGNSPKEQYDYAFTLLRQQNFDGAESAFRAFLQKFPADRLSGNAQYWLGETHYARKQWQQAAVAFADGFKKFPQDNKAPDNLLKLSLSLANLNKSKEACDTLGALKQRYPSAPQPVQDRAQQTRERLKCKA
jgi:tol-pal system protein YbgF